MTVHETRVDCALALNGWVVFCSCGNLTGFADDAAGADKIAAKHVAKCAAQSKADLTGVVHFVLENEQEVWVVGATAKSELWPDREPAFVCEPHNYHPAL